VANERFITWARPELISDFRKLYGVIDHDLAAGSVLTFRVVSSFDSTSYGGAKALVLTTCVGGWVGGCVAAVVVVLVLVLVLLLVSVVLAGFVVLVVTEEHQ
jgi:hypothetical protein